MTTKSLEISPEQIEQRIQEIARELDRDYADKNWMIIAILKGSICLVADLMRALSIPVELDFIRCSSYGMRGVQGGSLIIEDFDRFSVADRHILLIDDILDTGQTLKSVVELFQSEKPASLRTLVLLNKNKTPIQIKADYVLFDIADQFVVGYGLDYKEQMRQLSGIYSLSNITD